MTDFTPIYMHAFGCNEDIISEFGLPAGALDGCRVLLAYYHVGSWGCDSSAFVLFEKDGKLFEVNAGHCSCHGLAEQSYHGDGPSQWEPEETTIEALEHRLTQGSLGSVGGYDGDGYAEQSRAVVDYLKNRAVA